jgi:gliding motility-associated lipoprotein GldB
MNKRINNNIILLVLTVILLVSCSENKFKIDVSDIHINLKIERLDIDLLANYPDTPNVIALQQKYGNFLDLYSQGVIAIGGMANKAYAHRLLEFNKYCVSNGLSEKTDSVFKNIDQLQLQLTNAFKHFKYYFPNKEIPQIYTFLSAFNQSVVTDDGMIGIGLDKYLGRDCIFYKQLGWDNYKIRRMEKEMLPVDCMHAWAMMEFPYKDSIDNLLNQMVYEGKIQYFLDAMLPETPDSLKFGYTENQMEWAKYNENKMWAYLVDSETLFTNDHLLIRKFIGDAPFTQVFQNNSAPRSGVFLGWRIIHRYMDGHPDVSLKQLMEDDDYQGILNSADYRP